MRKVSYDVFLVALGAFLGVVAPAIVSWVKEIPFWSGFKFVFTYPIQLWIVLLILIGLFLIRKIRANKPVESAKYLSYTQERINGVLWKWKYIRTSPGKWGIDDLRPICPKCDTSTKHEYDHYSLNNSYKGTCLQCSNVIAPLRSKSDIEALIIDYIDREVYPNPT